MEKDTQTQARTEQDTTPTVVIERLTKILLNLVLTGLVGVLIYQAITLPDRVIARVDAWSAVVGQRLDERDKQLGKLLGNAAAWSEEAYWDNRASAETTAALLRESYEAVRETREKVIPAAQLAISELSKESLHTMQSVEQLADASTMLVNHTDGAVLASWARIEQSGDSVTALLNHADQVIADPNIPKAIANVEKTTQHVGEVAETVDIKTRPLRKKAGILRTILLTGLGLLRVNVF